MQLLIVSLCLVHLLVATQSPKSEDIPEYAQSRHKNVRVLVYSTCVNRIFRAAKLFFDYPKSGYSGPRSPVF